MKLQEPFTGTFFSEMTIPELENESTRLTITIIEAELNGDADKRTWAVDQLEELEFHLSEKYNGPFVEGEN